MSRNHAFALWLAALAACLHAQERSSATSRPTSAPLELVQSDIAYAQQDVAQKLDLYLPAQRPFRTVLFVYGGGWHGGSYKNLAVVAAALQHHGLGCALVGHRLSPPHRWPAMIEDVAAAFAWLHGHIAEHGGDAGELLLAGHSSGAQLVLLLASDPRWLEAHHLAPVDVRGVLGLSTPVDLRPGGGGAMRFGDTLMMARGADVFGRDREVMAQASPIVHLVRTLPPTLLVVGDHDFPMLAGDAADFAARAKELGMTVPVLRAAGHTHGTVPRVLVDDPLAPRLREFLADPAAFVRAAAPVKPSSRGHAESRPAAAQPPGARKGAQ